jgi:hypothetical protein
MSCVLLCSVSITTAPVAPKPSCKAKQNPRQINTPELNSSLSTVTEESDWTGDSGMGTGSGTTAYEVIVWKNAIQHPPPGIYIHYCTQHGIECYYDSPIYL